MFEILVIAAFFWLMFKAIGLAFKLTWGIAKFVAGILMAFALPVLFVCLFFVSGIALVIPLALLGIAIGILKVCT
jgi:hypothetical protein